MHLPLVPLGYKPLSRNDDSLGYWNLYDNKLIRSARIPQVSKFSFESNWMPNLYGFSNSAPSGNIDELKYVPIRKTERRQSPVKMSQKFFGRP